MSTTNYLAVRRAYWFAMSLALVSFSSQLALASSGTEGASFLDIPVGAGPAALGSAYTALATDAYAPVWNPAGLGFLDGTQIAGQHLSYLESINHEFASFVHSFNKERGIGASVQYLGTGNMKGTNPGGTPAPDFSSYYASYNLSIGQKMGDKFSFGLTGKAIQAKIADVSASAYAVDFGTLYRSSNKASLAATLTNVGSPLTFENQKDSLPLAFHVAGAYELDSHWGGTAEGVYFKTGLLSGRFGLQWRPLEAIAIRAGYKTDNMKELSALAGFTTGIGINLWGQEFAYAWVPYGDLGDTQYFSLLLKFGAKEEQKRNLIHYQTIKKHRTARNLQASDPEYEQLMQILNDSPEHLAQGTLPQ